MIHVFFTDFDMQLPDDLWHKYLTQLPESLQHRILRYARWQDRQAGLFGKLLLLEGLHLYGYADDCLNQLSTTKFGRPFLNLPLDFNISHSGGAVVCAITDQGRVGMDVEQIREIALPDFERTMTAAEWQIIHASSDPYAAFLAYWAKKESVMKADGRGFSLLLDAIRLEQNRAMVEQKIWQLHEISLAPQYACCLAHDTGQAEIAFHRSKLC